MGPRVFCAPYGCGPHTGHSRVYELKAIYFHSIFFLQIVSIFLIYYLIYNINVPNFQVTVILLNVHLKNLYKIIQLSKYFLA